jgi:hypothetical protein
MFTTLERVMFAVVYTAAIVVLAMDMFVWRPY